MRPLIMGIDIGTTGCKTALYCEDGVELAQSYREYKLHHPANGWAEEDPEDWWRSVVSTTKEVLAAPGIRPECIAALGVSCTNGLVVVDKNGQPLLPAILMIDQRSAPQADWIKQNLGEKECRCHYRQPCGSRRFFRANPALDSSGTARSIPEDTQISCTNRLYCPASDRAIYDRLVASIRNHAVRYQAKKMV